MYHFGPRTFYSSSLEDNMRDNITSLELQTHNEIKVGLPASSSPVADAGWGLHGSGHRKRKKIHAGWAPMFAQPIPWWYMTLSNFIFTTLFLGLRSARVSNQSKVHQKRGRTRTWTKFCLVLGSILSYHIRMPPLSILKCTKDSTVMRALQWVWNKVNIVMRALQWVWNM